MSVAKVHVCVAQQQVQSQSKRIELSSRVQMTILDACTRLDCITAAGAGLRQHQSRLRLAGTELGKAQARPATPAQIRDAVVAGPRLFATAMSTKLKVAI